MFLAVHRLERMLSLMKQNNIKILQIKRHKIQFLSLLLMADEQENMIEKYLERGEMFALYEDEVKCVCIVTQENEHIFELKNIATVPQYRRQGYAKTLIHHIIKHYRGKGQFIQVGTGEVPTMLTFYQKCGFSPSHRVKNFFTENYNHPIIEDGIELKDMIYLQQKLV